MSLDEFKAWLNVYIDQNFKTHRYLTLSDVNVIKEKLAEVENDKSLNCSCGKSAKVITSGNQLMCLDCAEEIMMGQTYGGLGAPFSEVKDEHTS